MPVFYQDNPVSLWHEDPNGQYGSTHILLQGSTVFNQEGETELEFEWWNSYRAFNVSQIVDLNVGFLGITNSAYNTFQISLYDGSSSTPAYVYNTNVSITQYELYNIKIKIDNITSGGIDWDINGNAGHIDITTPFEHDKPMWALSPDNNAVTRQLLRQRNTPNNEWTTIIDAHVVKKGSTEYSDVPAPADGWHIISDNVDELYVTPDSNGYYAASLVYADEKECVAYYGTDRITCGYKYSLSDYSNYQDMKDTAASNAGKVMYDDYTEVVVPDLQVVRCCILGFDGLIYLATSAGILSLNPDTLEIKRYPYTLNNYVRIALFNDGNIYFVVTNNLIKFDLTTKTYTNTFIYGLTSQGKIFTSAECVLSSVTGVWINNSNRALVQDTHIVNNKLKYVKGYNSNEPFDPREYSSSLFLPNRTITLIPVAGEFRTFDLDKKAYKITANDLSEYQLIPVSITADDRVVFSPVYLGSYSISNWDYTEITPLLRIGGNEIAASGKLLPTGEVILLGDTDKQYRIVNPADDSIRTIGQPIDYTSLWQSQRSVLLPDNRLFVFNADNSMYTTVRIFNPNAGIQPYKPETYLSSYINF